jgi:adenylate cyclase
VERRLAAILAADVVGYSKLMDEDETVTLSALRSLRNEIFGPAIAGNRGHIIKNMGDGWLVEFPSAVSAVNAAMRVQDHLVDHPLIKLRIGIHVGDVVFENEDIFGSGVNIAARLQEVAEPSSLNISDATFVSLDGSLAPSFEDIGALQLKNIRRPMQSWCRQAVRAPTPSGAKPAADSSDVADSGFPSLALVPVQTNSDDIEIRELADAITHDLATYVSAPEWLISKVVEERPAESYVLSATIRARQDRLRLEVSLSAPDDQVIWRDKIDGDVAQSFDWQDEAGEAIAGQTIDHILEHSIGRFSQVDPEKLSANQCLLFAFGSNRTLEATHYGEVIKYVERAIEKSSDNALAFQYGAALISSGVMMGYQQQVGPYLQHFETWADNASEMSRHDGRVFSLAPLIALMRKDDPSKRLAQIEDQLKKAPFNADSLLACGWGYIYLGEPQLAIDCIQKAGRFGSNPSMHGSGQAAIALAHLMLGDNNDAARQAEAVVSRIPSYSASYRILAAAHGNLGNIEDAKRNLEKLQTLAPGETITNLKERGGYPDNTETQRYFSGLRLAGMPE